MDRRTVVCGASGYRSRCRLLLLACPVLLGLFVLPAGAKAQVLYGTITGNVTDASGAVMPAASRQ